MHRTGRLQPPAAIQINPAPYKAARAFVFASNPANQSERACSEAGEQRIAARDELSRIPTVTPVVPYSHAIARSGLLLDDDEVAP
jgi:hypothetical protein